MDLARATGAQAETVGIIVTTANVGAESHLRGVDHPPTGRCRQTNATSNVNFNEVCGDPAAAARGRCGRREP